MLDKEASAARHAGKVFKVEPSKYFLPMHSIPNIPQVCRSLRNSRPVALILPHSKHEAGNDNLDVTHDMVLVCVCVQHDMIHSFDHI